jgi:hypothetical protein
LRNRRLAFQARFPNPSANDVSAGQLMRFFHGYVKCGIHILDIYLKNWF